MKMFNIPISPQEVAAQIQAGEQREAALIKTMEDVIKNRDAVSDIASRIRAALKNEDREAILQEVSSLCLVLADVFVKQYDAIANELHAEIDRTRQAVSAMRGILINAPAPERRQ